MGLATTDRPGVVPLSVFDAAFNGVPHSEMYRAWMMPELFPAEPQPRLSNWPAQDLEMFCGGEFTKGYNKKEVA